MYQNIYFNVLIYFKYILLLIVFNSWNKQTMVICGCDMYKKLNYLIDIIGIIIIITAFIFTCALLLTPV